MNPLEHTIIIEADISSSVAKNAHQKIKEHDDFRKGTETSQGSIFLTTKNKKPDTKSQQERWEKENNETDILQMGLHSR